VLPPPEGNPSFPYNGEGGAIKTLFKTSQPGILTFDWNHVGDQFDGAYFSLWSDDAETPFRTIDWLYHPALGFTLKPSSVQLCTRYYETHPLQFCGPPGTGLNIEIGWQTRSLVVPSRGAYWIGFHVSEDLEGTIPSVLGLDNVRFEPVSDLLRQLRIDSTGVGQGNSLASKVVLAQISYAASDVQATCAMMRWFELEVRTTARLSELTPRPAPWKISQEKADQLLEDSGNIMMALNCG
jgi:hypothetical protein